MKKTKITPQVVFVTGADGMLGASICRELIEIGFEVIGLVMPNRNVNVLDNLNMTIIQGDLLDPASYESILPNVDYIINVAALTNIWPRKSEIVSKVNLNGALLIAELVLKYQIKRFIQIGSASSFGNGTEENPANESFRYDSAKYNVDYITSKYFAQKALLELHQEKQLPVLIINPTYMIGPFDSGPSSGKMILEFCKGKLPAFPSGGKNFIFSLDVAKAVVNSLSKGRLGECYIVGNENLSFADFLKKVAETNNMKFNIIKVPNFVMYLLGIVNSMSARIFKKTPQISFTMAKMSTVRQFYSAQKAIDELDLPQTPIENAINECIKWFKHNDYI